MVTVSQIDRIVNNRGQVYVIQATATVAEAARGMRDMNVGSLVVIDKSRNLIGIVTERDILGKVVAADVSPDAITVSEIMTSPIISCQPDTSVDTAQRMMAQHGVRHLPLVHDGVPVGMVSSRDIMAQQLRETKQTLGRQSEVLDRLEQDHPGITRLQRDPVGRIVI